MADVQGRIRAKANTKTDSVKANMMVICIKEDIMTI